MLTKGIGFCLLYKVVNSPALAPSVTGIMHKLHLFLKPVKLCSLLNLLTEQLLSSEKLPLPVQSTASEVNQFASIKILQNNSFASGFSQEKKDVVLFRHRHTLVCFTGITNKGECTGKQPQAVPLLLTFAHCNYTLKANEKLIYQFDFKTQSISLIGTRAFHRHVGLTDSYSSKNSVFDAVKHTCGFHKYPIKSALKFVYCTLWKLRKTQTALPANPPCKNRALQSKSSDTRPQATKFN